MRTFLITLLITVTTSLSLSADNIYILYSTDCMDKMEYDKKNEGEDYYAYRINANRDEEIILEVGKKATDKLSSLPTPFIGCYNGKFDKRLVKRINTNINNYFVVTPVGKKFEIRPIRFASHYQKKGEWISYTSPKYSFRFNLIAGTIGENISQSSDAKVYFEGILPEDCFNAYLFRQLPNGTSKEYIDIKFIPEVGLVNEQVGTSPGDDSRGNSTLVKVNKTRYKFHVANLCGSEFEEEEPMAYTDERVKEQPREFTTKGGGAYVADYQTEKLPPPPAQEYHTVARGETLYAIAREYKISVSDIKKWNRKKGSSISRGEKLRIVEATAIGNPSKMTAKSGQMVWEKDVKKKAPSKIISKHKATPPPVYTNKSEHNNTGTYHTVKPGETVAYLAMKYGYTEARFRKMNNLNERDYLKVNQRIKTDDCPCSEGNYSDATPPSKVMSKPSYRAVKTPISPAPYYNSDLTAKGGAAINEKFEDEQPMSYEYSSTNSSGPQVRLNNSNNNNEKSISEYYYPSPVGKKRIAYPSPESKKMLEKDLSPKGVSNEVINGTDGVKRRIHVVQEGETLYRIARYYNMKVESVLKLNNLERGEVLMPYQRLYVD